QLHDAANQLQRTLAEGELGSPRSAEQGGDESERRPRIPSPESRIPDIREHQGGTTRGNHASMTFSGFEMAIDRRLHRDDVAVAAEALDRIAGVQERLRGRR